jgi:hypothetical protein
MPVPPARDLRLASSRGASTGRRRAGPGPEVAHPLRAPAGPSLVGTAATWPGPSTGTSRDGLAAGARRPVTRILRTVPDVEPRPAPAPAAGPEAPAAPPPGRQPMDLDRLDRDLWKRFEKRIRVEQERRGRR